MLLNMESIYNKYIEILKIDNLKKRKLAAKKILQEEKSIIDKDIQAMSQQEIIEYITKLMILRNLAIFSENKREEEKLEKLILNCYKEICKNKDVETIYCCRKKIENFQFNSYQDEIASKLTDIEAELINEQLEQGEVKNDNIFLHRLKLYLDMAQLATHNLKKSIEFIQDIAIKLPEGSNRETLLNKLIYYFNEYIDKSPDNIKNKKIEIDQLPKSEFDPITLQLHIFLKYENYFLDYFIVNKDKESSGNDGPQTNSHPQENRSITLKDLIDRDNGNKNSKSSEIDLLTLKATYLAHQKPLAGDILQLIAKRIRRLEVEKDRKYAINITRKQEKIAALKLLFFYILRDPDSDLELTIKLAREKSKVLDLGFGSGFLGTKSRTENMLDMICKEYKSAMPQDLKQRPDFNIWLNSEARGNSFADTEKVINTLKKTRRFC